MATREAASAWGRVYTTLCRAVLYVLTYGCHLILQWSLIAFPRVSITHILDPDSTYKLIPTSSASSVSFMSHLPVPAIQQMTSDHPGPSSSDNKPRIVDSLRLRTGFDDPSLDVAISPGCVTPLSAPPLFGPSQPYINPLLLKRRSSCATSPSPQTPQKPWHGGPGQTTVSGGGGPQGRQISLGITNGQNSTSGIAGGTGNCLTLSPCHPEQQTASL